MKFEYLDQESEQLLKEILEMKVLPKTTFRGEIIDFYDKK